MSEDLSLLAESPPAPAARVYARKAHEYGHLGIQRRTFFRWKGHGEKVGDWPPFDEPVELEAWYDRMRALGRFKNAMPRDIATAIAAHLSGATPPSSKSSSSATPPPAVSRPAPPPTAEQVEFESLEGELVQLRDRVAALRQARDAAYVADQRTEGDLQDKRYREAFAELTIAEKRALEVMERRGLLIPRSGVEQELAPRITGIVVGGIHFLEKAEAELDAIPDHAARRERRRELWLEHCSAIIQARFVPEWMKKLPRELWSECVEYLRAKAPIDLKLAA